MFRRAAVLLVVAGLIAGLAPADMASPAGAAGASAAQPSDDTDARDGWRPASEGGKPGELAGPRRLGYEAVPRRDPARTPQPKPEPRRVREVPERRKASSRVYQLDDGRLQQELSATPLHYRDGAGQWQPIDPTVGRSPRPGFALGNETNTFRTYFGSNPGSLVRLEAAEGAVTLGTPGAQPGNPVADKNRVTYANGLGQGLDLAYEVTSESLKESVVVKARPAGEGDLSVRFGLQVEGLQAHQSDDGSIVFERPGGDGGAVLVMPAPFMVDAAEDLASPYGRAWSPDVTQTLSGDGRSVTVTADGEWLRAAERQFPVVIDPTIRIAPTPTQSQDTMILSGSPTTNYDTSWRLSVGRDSSTTAARSLLKFPLDIPAGTKIDTAQLQLWYDQFHTSKDEAVSIEARAATRAWDATTATWNQASSGVPWTTLGGGGDVGDLGNYSVQVDDEDWFTGMVGAWPESTNTTFTQHAVNSDYLSNSGAATGDTYTWYPCLNEAGNYRVDAHYVTASDRATAAPYTVNHRDGSSPYTVNQSAATVAGKWTRLGTGTFPHESGCFTGNVVLGDSANKVVVADAVKWTKDATLVRPAGEETSRWHSFSVQNLVQGWVNNPTSNHGFVLRAVNDTAVNTTTPLGGPRYEASEYAYGGEAANRPKLVVTYGRPGVELAPPTVLHATGAELSWTAYVDPCTAQLPGCDLDDIVEYEVHRSVHQTFTPNASTLVAPVPNGTTTYRDTTAEPTPADTDEPTDVDEAFGNAYYYMVAVKTRDGQVTPGPTQLVRLPKAGRVTRVYPASYDTTLTTGQPDAAHDTMYGQPWLYAGNNSGDPYRTTRALVRFPALAGIPTGTNAAKVVDVKVRLWNREVVGDGSATWEMRALSQDFDEAASWNKANATTAWTTPGGTAGAPVSTRTGFTNDPTRRVFTGTGLASLVQGWVANPANNKGLMVKLANETSPQARAIFLSSEGAEPGLRPELSVTYLEPTPESTYHAPVTPDAVEANTTTKIPVTLTNTTNANWTTDKWAMSYRWTNPDGTPLTGAPQVRTDLPEQVDSGESVIVEANVQAPAAPADGNGRSGLVLAWDLVDKTTGTYLSAAATNKVGALTQAMAVEDSTSDQVGLESFYAYAGKNTGAGSTLMNNLHAGNAVWSYDIFSNPSRGLSTFLRLAYNSKDTSDSVAGYGWSLQASSVMRLGVPLDPHPNELARKVSLTDGDGTTHVWTLDDKGTPATGDDEYKNPAGVHLYLQKNGTCEPNFQQDPKPDAWFLTKPDRTKFTFNCAGYVTSITDNTTQNQMRFVYEVRRSNNQPTHFLKYIEDATGRRTLTVDYYTKGQNYEFINDTTWARQSGTNLTSPHIIDKVSRVTDISDPANPGRTVTFTYTDKGLLGELVDGAGSSQPKRFAFRYDMTQGNKNVKLVRVADPKNNATTIGYYSTPTDDPKFKWSTKTITDRLTYPTTFAYSDPDGTTEDPDTNVENVKTVVTDAESRATTYMTDNRGRPVQSTNAKNYTTKLRWDPDNNVERLEEANGAVNTWSYDPKTGYPLEIKDAGANANNRAGTRLRYQTGLNGYTAELIEKQSPEGRLWRFGYTPLGDLASVTDPMGTFTPTDGDYTTRYTYDAFGQLLTATDANGNVTEYRNYDANGYPRAIADARQRQPTVNKATAFEYDLRGRATAVIDTRDIRTTQAYDLYGRPLESRVPKRQAANEYIVTPAPLYDANDNILKVTAPELHVNGARTGEPGAVSEAIYDAADQLTDSLAPRDEVADPERRTKFTYDRVGNLKTTTEPKGTLTPLAGDYTTTNTYDEIYQLTDVTNADGHKLSYRYDNVGNVTHVVDPRKNMTANPDDYTTWAWYDGDHRPIVRLDPVSYEVTTYDWDGLVVELQDGGQNKSYLDPDARGLLAEVRVPYDGTGTSIAYRTTRYEYDQVGNRTRVVTPRGTATAAANDFVHETVYDELNRVKEELTPVDPAAADARDRTVHKTAYSYDNDGHLTRVSAPPSDTQTVRNDTAYTHFDNGWVASSTDPWGIVSSYDYNPLGQQTLNKLSPAGVDPTDQQSLNRTMTWTYFGDGKLRSRSDAGIPVGRSLVLADNSDPQSTAATGTWARASTGTGFHGYDYATHEAGAGTDTFDWSLDVPQDGNYDVYVRIPTVSGAAVNASYKLTYQDNAQVTKSIDQVANAGKWVNLGRYPFKQGAGRLSLAQNQNARVVADAVRLERDSTGQTDNESINFGYKYDPNGNLTVITESNLGTAVDRYDVGYTGLNQVSEVRESKAGAPLTVSGFKYDPNGAIKEATHPRSYAAFEYEDPRNLLSKVTNGTSSTDPAKKVSTFTYTPKAERFREVKGNGNTVEYGYFHDGSLKTQVERKANGTLVSEHTIGYEPNGNRARDVSRTMNADNTADLLETTTTYTYDPRDRVATVERAGDGAGTETYKYDANSNVVTQGGSGDPRNFVYDRNRLVTSSVGPYAGGYTYDPFGRLETARLWGMETERYTYDGFDRILSHRASGRTTSYTYDPLDRTETKTTNAGTASAETTRFNYLGLSGEVLDEQIAGRITKSYQYSPWGERLSQVTHKADGSKEDGYYGYNAHSDVETVTDASGNSKSTYGYTAYGSNNAALFTGVDKPTASEPTATTYNVYRYNSKRWDSASAGYDMGFRNYSPGLNRFVTRDWYNGALSDLNLGLNPYTNNRYAYGAGNPISNIEQDGHLPLECASGEADCSHGTSANSGWEVRAPQPSETERGIAREIDRNADNPAFLNAVAVEINECVGYGISDISCGYTRPPGANSIGDYYPAAVELIARGIMNEAIREGALVPTGYGTYQLAECAPACLPMWDNAGEDLSGGDDQRYEMAIAMDIGIAITNGFGALVINRPSGTGARTPAAACSFSAETEVVLADGSTKPIDEIEVGDEVLAQDPETGERGPRRVTHIWKHEDTVVDLEIDGDVITTTPDHPFWNAADGEWQEARNLDTGDLVVTAEGGVIEVEGLRPHTARSMTAFNLTVDGIHTYFVGAGEDDVLVHNTCPMLGSGGTQVTSKTLTNRPGYRIDVENPAPGVRPGQLHLQTAAGDKYLYDFEAGGFTGLPRSLQRQIANDPAAARAIATGRRYLGLDP